MKRFLRYSTAFGFCCLFVLQFVLLWTDADAQGVQIHIAKDASLQVEAHWQPDADAWLKLYKNSQYTKMFDLKTAHPTKEYGAEAFKAFLPAPVDLDGNPVLLKVGDVWAYKVRDVLPFLQQFHPSATADLSAQRGGFACLRALSPRYAEIVFQFHADFDIGMPMKAKKEMSIEALSTQAEELEQLQATLESSKATIEPLKAELAEVEVLKAELAEVEVSAEKLNADIKALGEQSQKLADAILELEKADAIPAAQKSEFTELKREILKLSAALSALNMSLKSQSTLLSGKLTTLEKELESHFSMLNEEFEKRFTTLNVKIENRFTALNEKIENEFAMLETTLQRQSGALAKRLDALDTRVAERNIAHAYNTGIYFTPRQFIGRLLIERETGTIQAFSLGIPVHPGNATISAFGGVDTVSVPQMELIGKTPVDQGEITWTTAITAEEANEKLRSQFLAKQFRPRD